jgi:hypothetical protein
MPEEDLSLVPVFSAPLIRRARLGAWALLALGVFLGMGCGLDDYERRMDAQQKVLDDFDKLSVEEAKYLGDPLAMPRLKRPKKDEKGKVMRDDKGKVIEEEEDALSVPFFLRPPAGTGPTEATGGGPSSSGPVSLVRYLNSGEKAPCNGMTLYLAATREKMDQGKFKEKVCASLYPRIPKEAPALKEEKLALGKRRLLFLKVEHKSDATYRVYFFKAGDDQLAVAFKLPGALAKEPEVAAAIDASLKTLVVGSPRAELLRTAYQQGPRAFNQLRLQFAREDMRP